MRQLITPQEALQIVLQSVAPLPVETVAHHDALNRTLARDILSPVALPPFDNSAMDGYALLARDVQDAAPANPVALRVGETLAAGDFSQTPIQPGMAARIMTGAPLPPGCDAVVMREATDESNPEIVRVLASVEPGQNIRRAGSDIERGEVALRAGIKIRPAQWGLLASLEQARIEVFARPRVAIVATGAELVALGTPLQPGQIRDSNSYTLQGMAQACDATIVASRRAGDDPNAFTALMRELAQSCDCIVTSGGVSMGDFDPVRDVLPRIAEVLFWKIAMKPGKPVMFGTMAALDGRAIPVFGLPGNPVSVMVAWEQFVRPALLKMQGRHNLKRVEIAARVEETLTSPDGRAEFARVFVSQTANGWTARLTGDQGSGRLSTMAQANALLCVPAATTLVHRGDALNVQMIDWSEAEA